MTTTHAAEPYTPQMANRMLPLLRRIARDLQECHSRLRRRLGQLGADGGLETIRAHEVPEEVQRDLAEARDLNRELAELEVRVIDPELGLMTFPGLHGGELVHFCWKLGEDEVRYWYALGATYEQRHPLVTAAR